MIRNVMTDMGMTLGPTVALLLFVALFIAVVLWIYRPGSRKTYEAEAQLPLDDAGTRKETPRGPAPSSFTADGRQGAGPPHAEK